jgi:hypothetical protein
MSYAGFCETCKVPYYESDRLSHQHIQQSPPPSPREPEAREATQAGFVAFVVNRGWDKTAAEVIAYDIVLFANSVTAHLTAELATVRQQLEKSNGHAAECFRKERTRAESAESRVKELEAALLQAREALDKLVADKEPNGYPLWFNRAVRACKVCDSEDLCNFHHKIAERDFADCEDFVIAFTASLSSAPPQIQEGK